MLLHRQQQLLHGQQQQQQHQQQLLPLAASQRHAAAAHPHQPRHLHVHCAAAAPDQGQQQVSKRPCKMIVADVGTHSRRGTVRKVCVPPRSSESQCGGGWVGACWQGGRGCYRWCSSRVGACKHARAHGRSHGMEPGMGRTPLHTQHAALHALCEHARARRGRGKGPCTPSTHALLCTHATAEERGPVQRDQPAARGPEAVHQHVRRRV